MPGIDFGDQHYPVAQTADRLAHHFLRPAVGVHFRRIDHRQSMVDARPQCSHFLLTLRHMFAHIPGAQPDGRHCRLLAEAYCFFTIFSSLTVCHHKSKTGRKALFCCMKRTVRMHNQKV